MPPRKPNQYVQINSRRKKELLARKKGNKELEKSITNKGNNTYVTSYVNSLGGSVARLGHLHIATKKKPTRKYASGLSQLKRNKTTTYIYILYVLGECIPADQSANDITITGDPSK